ncbi:MAG: sigma-70 family RNA polymerase sigma factor [Pseudomonadales bacterium]|nr:sigma-70 family RNA polymerase sigma factor [Pseudomonadales bacterium]MCP5185613.1 sigma-70 family RNA polymerase sigma factor [Pseudomonadales bacterium]
MNSHVPQATSEAALISRAAQGDMDAFATLYRQHHRRVYAVCRRLVGDAGLAEELTQDTFVNAWKALARFRGDAAFGTWLVRIATNLVISYQRRHGPWLAWLRRGEELDDAAVESTGGERLDLDRAIDRLPTRARQVFVLVEIEGLSHEEAGQQLGMAIGTSKAQLHRARQLLRGFLS